MDQLPCTEMVCLYEFEPQTLFPIASDDSVLRVFNSMEEETHARPYKYFVVNLIDLKVLNVKRFSLFSEYPFVETPQT